MKSGSNKVPPALDLLDNVCRESGISLLPLIVRTCRWVDPKTFRLMPVWYPETCRNAPAFDRKYEKQYKSKEGKPRTHANEFAREALRLAMGLSRECLDKNWVACHIWGIDDPGNSRRNAIVQNPRYFSCIGNMVFLPAPLAGLTDSVQEIKHALRICAYNLYGWRPELVDETRKSTRALCRTIPKGYKAILVYDISRWGRFQNTDEAGHYEFLCRSAGIQVHYCAEQFSNDNSMPNSMMKALKRIMAGEYSRELSVKVHEGAKRVSRYGFRTGGTPGFGLRRMLVSATREPKCMLGSGERKSLQSDRVILVPGPEHEVRWVREIFRMFVEEQMWPDKIAAKLRKHKVLWPGMKRTAWYGQAVNRLLRNPKYCGCSVFGQNTRRLRTPNIRNPRKSWLFTQGAWDAIIDEDTFEKAQQRFENPRAYKDNSDLLNGLRRLLAERGSLSEEFLNESQYLPSAKPYVDRFGSLSEAFEQIGYVGPRLKTTRTRRQVRSIRDQLVRELLATEPNTISMVQPDGHYRPRLIVSGMPVSLYVCPHSLSSHTQKSCWKMAPVPRERECIALMARLQTDNGSIKDLFVVPDTLGQTRYILREDDPWLRRGKKLASISDFLSTVHLVNYERATKQSRNDSPAQFD